MVRSLAVYTFTAFTYGAGSGNRRGCIGGLAREEEEKKRDGAAFNTEFLTAVNTGLFFLCLSVMIAVNELDL